MKRFLKAIRTISQCLIILAIVSVATIYLGSKVGWINPIRPYVVLSGSMEPKIKTGGIVLVTQKNNGYQVGDVITFTQGANQTTTHRIFKIDNQNGETVYTTKGDANNAPDPGTVIKQNIVGSVIFSLPYLGYGVDFAKKPQGFILLVIVPATIIVYEELRFLLSELKTKFSRKTKKTTVSDPVADFKPVVYLKAPLLPQRFLVRQNESLEPEVPANRAKIDKKRPIQGIDKRFVLIPTIAVLAIFLGVTGSYLMDQETSVGNILGAAASYDEDGLRTSSEMISPLSDAIVLDETVQPSPTPTPAPAAVDVTPTPEPVEPSPTPTVEPETESVTETPTPEPTPETIIPTETPTPQADTGGTI